MTDFNRHSTGIQLVNFLGLVNFLSLVNFLGTYQGFGSGFINNYNWYIINNIYQSDNRFYKYI